jgi:hypothetical protein
MRRQSLDLYAGRDLGRSVGMPAVIIGAGYAGLLATVRLAGKLFLIIA